MKKILNGQIPANPLEKGIEAAKTGLLAQRVVRESKCLEMFAGSIVCKLEDYSTKMMSIMQHEKAWKKSLTHFVCSKIVEAVDGNFAVPHYNPDAKAKQVVYVFLGTHWVILDQQRYFDLIKDCCRKMCLEESLIDDHNYMNNVYENVAFRVSRYRQCDIPNGEAWVNMQNGTLELHMDGTIKFREHNRDDFFVYVLPYVYDPQATCEKWEAFLNQMLPDKDVQQLLAEYIGYSFTHGIKGEKMLVLYGHGSNGKSVVLDTIDNLLGSNNVSNVSLDDLTNEHERRSMIEGKLVNISRESGSDLKPDVLKTLISGEPVTIRELYKGSRQMTSYAKLITSFNVLPRPENTHGWFRRWILMPFNVTIAEKDADLDLSKKLEIELPGILNWVLAATKEFLARNTFTESEVCNSALQKYKLMSDNVKLFVIENCETNYPYNTSGKELYRSYKQVCSEDGVKPVGKQKFYERLKDLPDVECKMSGNVPFFNLKLISIDGKAF